MIPDPQLVMMQFVSIIPISIAFALTLHQYLKTKYQHLLYLSICWFSFMMGYIFQAIARSFLSLPLTIVAHFSGMPMGFFMVWVVDTLMQDKISPIKLMILTIMTTLFVVSALTPGSYFIYNDGVYDYVGYSTIHSVLLAGTGGISGVLMLYFLIKTASNAPKSLKNWAYLAVFGSSLVGIITPIWVIMRSSLHEHGIETIAGLDLIMMSLGILIASWAIFREPKLAFVLPFQAYRLIIFDTQSGTAIFSHKWQKGFEDKEVSETLFAGMLHGISLIINDSVNKGNLKEIHLDNAVLLLNRAEHHHIACVVIASESSKSLKKALRTFTSIFEKTFSLELKNTTEVSKFDGTKELINNNFPFIPIYD